MTKPPNNASWNLRCNPITPENEKLIENYIDAYKAFNGCYPPRITYENGWFVFRYADGGHSAKFRRKQIEEMTGRLLEWHLEYGSEPEKESLS